jgi:hypothetical protein
VFFEAVLADPDFEKATNFAEVHERATTDQA